MKQLLYLFLFVNVCLSSSCSEKSQRRLQYISNGHQLYLTHCVNCHQENGSGLAELIPPINQADYIKQYPQKVACMIVYGIEGEMVVNGKTYNAKMPANKTLTATDVAYLMAYLNNAWGQAETEITDTKTIEQHLKNCKK